MFLSWDVPRGEPIAPQLRGQVIHSWASPRSFYSPRLGACPLRGPGFSSACPESFRFTLALSANAAVTSGSLAISRLLGLAELPSLALLTSSVNRGRLRPAEGRAAVQCRRLSVRCQGVGARRDSREGRCARRGGRMAPERSLVGSIARGSQRLPQPFLAARAPALFGDGVPAVSGEPLAKHGRRSGADGVLRSRQRGRASGLPARSVDRVRSPTRLPRHGRTQLAQSGAVTRSYIAWLVVFSLRGQLASLRRQPTPPGFCSARAASSSRHGPLDARHRRP